MKDTVETRMSKMLKQKYGDTTLTNGPSAENAAVGGALAGSMKSVILGNEFDLLFGYEGISGGTPSNNSQTDNDFILEELLQELLQQAQTRKDKADDSNMERGEL
jgi:hypothetical protein